MSAAQLFNECAGTAGPVYGAVTSSEAWQFLRLDGAALTLHNVRAVRGQPGGVLVALQAALRTARANGDDGDQTDARA